MDDFLNRNPALLERDLVVRYLPINEIPIDEIPIDEELRGEVDEFNRDVARVNGETTAVHRDADAAVQAAPTSDDPEALLKALDAKRRHTINDAQQLARLWRRRGEIVERLAADHEAAMKAARNAAGLLKDELLSSLENLGFEIGKPQGFNFDAVVKVQHPGVRSAYAEAEALRSSLSRLVQGRRQNAEAIEKTDGFVRAIATKIASGKI